MERDNKKRGAEKRNGIPREAGTPAKRKAKDQVSGIFYVNNLAEDFKELLSADPINQIGYVIEVESGTEYYLFACVEKLSTSPKVDGFFRFRNYLDLQFIGVRGIIITQETKLSAVSGKPITKEIPTFSEAKFKEDVSQRPASSVLRMLKRIYIPTVDVKTATSLPKGQSVLCLKALTRMVKDQEKETSPGKVITLFDQSCEVPLKVLIKEEHLHSVGHIPREDEAVCLHHFKTHRGKNQTYSMLISTETSLIEIVRDEATLEGFKSIEHGQTVEGEIQECSMGKYLACPNTKCHLKKVDRIPSQGGYGNFKVRIARLLTKEDSLSLATFFEFPRADYDAIKRSEQPGLDFVTMIDVETIITAKDISKIIDALEQIDMRGIARQIEELFAGDSSDLWKCGKCQKQYKKDELSEGLRMVITSEGSKGEITEWVMFTQSIAPYVPEGTDPSDLPTQVVSRKFTARRSGKVLNEVNIDKCLK